MKCKALGDQRWGRGFGGLCRGLKGWYRSLGGGWRWSRGRLGCSWIRGLDGPGCGGGWRPSRDLRKLVEGSKRLGGRSVVWEIGGGAGLWEVGSGAGFWEVVTGIWDFVGGAGVWGLVQGSKRLEVEQGSGRLVQGSKRLLN